MHLIRTRVVCAALLAFAVVALISQHAATAAVQYSDATFNDVDWTGTKIVDTTGGGANFTASQIASGGNPGAYRRNNHFYDTGTIQVAHLRNGATYDPSVQGAASNIQISYDLIHLSPPQNQAVAFGLLVFQNGSYYAGPEDLIFDESWTHFANTRSASDLNRVAGAGPDHPDFSASGQSFQVGFYSLNNSSGGLLTRSAGIDNWNVTINAVPEPASVGLLAIAGIAAFPRRRRA
jgi:hypothetical protein